MITHSNASAQNQGDVCKQHHSNKLDEQVKALTEWKMKAIVQLEYFRTACRIYKFCDINQLNNLLND